MISAVKEESKGSVEFGFLDAEFFRIVECVLQFLPHRGEVFLISNFRRVLNVAFFLLGNSLASEFYAYRIQTPGNYPEERIQKMLSTSLRGSQFEEIQADRVLIK